MHYYETDVIAWADEQAALIRARRFDLLDVEHIADEIEDVGKSELREFTSHLAGLIAHLLKWQHQLAYRGSSWEKTIRYKRKELRYNLQRTPSLKARLQDAEWFDLVFGNAVTQAMSETGLDCFPENCPWTLDQIMDDAYFPD
jgi:hypothetical protein